MNDTLYLIFANSTAYYEAVKEWQNKTSRFVIKAEVPFSKIDIGYNDDFPHYIASKLLNIFIMPSEDMIPNDKDIIYISRQESIDIAEIKSITELPKIQTFKF